jgi:hypothetical protein
LIKTVSGAQIDVQAMPHTDPTEPAEGLIHISFPGEGPVPVVVTRDEIRAIIGALTQMWGELGEHGFHAHDEQ